MNRCNIFRLAAFAESRLETEPNAILLLIDDLGWKDGWTASTDFSAGDHE